VEMPAATARNSARTGGAGETRLRARSLVRWSIVAAIVSVVLSTVGVSPAYGTKAPKPKKPGAPTAVQVIGVNTAISVTWGPPTSNGGSPITGYTVTAMPHNETCTTTGALRCTVTGLLNGHKYNVKVRAINAQGTGRPSTAEYATPSTTPACSYIGVDANLQRCDLAGADLAGADLSGALLTGADLSGANLSDANLTGANLSNADLADANLTGADLTGANVGSADLAGVQLAGALMSGLSSGGVTGTPASLPANWQLVSRYGYLIGPGAALASAYFTGNELTGADLAGALLQGANLTGCDLSGTDLSNANLFAIVSGGLTGSPASLPTGWTLDDGYLIGTSADLADARLAGADLTGVSLTNTDLDGADLTGATLTDVTSGGIVGTPAALPGSWVLDDGYLIGPGANLAAADLLGVQLMQMDLHGANLTNADLYESVLNGSNLAGSNLTGALLKAAYLEGVNLTGADVENADLVLADLSQANVSGTDFGGASLGSVSSGFITGTPSALPTGWSLVSGYLVGPSARLRGAAFAGADLAGADLLEADLTGADLTDANLAGANLTDAGLTAVTWSNTTCPDGTNSDADGDTCSNNLG